LAGLRAVDSGGDAVGMAVEALAREATLAGQSAEVTVAAAEDSSGTGALRQGSSAAHGVNCWR
jgi:hypothetical protein